MSPIKAIAAPIIAAIMAAVLGHCNAGCLPATDADRKAADAAYIAETTACVKNANSKAESRYCRSLVNRRYGLCDGSFNVPCDGNN